jgi:plastocyanin
MKTRSLLSLTLITMLLAACAPAAVATSSPGNTAPSSASVGSTGIVSVNISNFAFDPGSISIRVGETVTWTNQDGATHNVAADDGSFKSGSLGQGDTFSYTFNTAGTFTYHCGFHASMLGTVIVQP